MIALIVLLGIPSFFPNLPFSPFLKAAGLQGVSALLLGVLLLLRKKDGSRFAKTDDLARAGLTWDIVLLVTSTLSLSALMKTEQVAIIPKVTGALVPVVSQLSPMVFLIVTIALFWVVTQVTHNFVIVLTLVGALSGVCAAMGINPWVFGWLFMCGMSFAYCTPAASSPGALMYAHEWINKKDAYINGILFSAVGIVIFMAIMMPLAMFVFGTI